jgi:hypothetical protein
MVDLLAQLELRLEIDKYSLDDEIVNQPSLFFQAADAYTEALAEHDACEAELATVDAELDGEVRAELERAKVKATEAMVKSEVLKHKRHLDAFDTYILAKIKSDKFKALKEAFHQRNYMLRELAGLYVSSYWERTAVQGTSKTDEAVYQRQRERLATARAKRNGDD